MSCGFCSDFHNCCNLKALLKVALFVITLDFKLQIYLNISTLDCRNNVAGCKLPKRSTEHSLTLTFRPVHNLFRQSGSRALKDTTNTGRTVYHLSNRRKTVHKYDEECIHIYISGIRGEFKKVIFQTLLDYVVLCFQQLLKPWFISFEKIWLLPMVKERENNWAHVHVTTNQNQLRQTASLLPSRLSVSHINVNLPT